MTTNGTTAAASKPHRKRARRGSLYVAVLSVTLIVSLMALSSMKLARLQLEATESADDRHQARILATSAIELAVAKFNTNGNWQADYTKGVEYPSTPIHLGDGALTWKLVDLGGGNLQLDGIGRAGGGVCVLSVDLETNSTLDGCVVIGGNLTVEAANSLTATNGLLAVNGSVSNAGTISADIEAQSISGSGAINGAQTTPGAIRTLPDPDRVFEYYLANGTYITPPSIGSEYLIEDRLLSPSSNPFGSANAKGIYIVDAQDTYGVRVKMSRIVGTLVVINLPDSQVFKIGIGVNWEPAYPNYPACLVDGGLEIRMQPNLVDETDLNTPNLNPAGTPYQGDFDSDQNDTYPCAVAGIIYCTKDLEIDGGNDDRTPDIQGQLISGGNCLLHKQTHPTVKNDNYFIALPPPGFGDGALNGPTQIRDFTPGVPTFSDKVGETMFWGQYIEPNLPANAIMWRLTKVEMYVEKLGGGWGDLHIVTYTPNDSKQPDTLIEDVSVAYGSLPASFGWVSAPITIPSKWLPANQAICVTLEARGGDWPANMIMQSSGVGDATAALFSGDGATWSSATTDKSLGYKIEAEYTTASGDAVRIKPGSWRQTASP